MSRWFRMYDELLDDPKVQRLSGEDFKAWVNILCLASRKDGELPPVEDIAFALRIDNRKAAAIVARLVSAKLLDETGNGFTPHGWKSRQYKSDVSTDRVKQFRKRKKAVSGNADETFHETAPDTDTETEVSEDKSSDAAASSDKEFWDRSKAYLGKSKSGLIGKWVRDYGKDQTARAITSAQIERAVEPVPYIEKALRNGAQAKANAPAVPI